LLAGLLKNYSPDFRKIQWKGGTLATEKKTTSFSGYIWDVTLGLRLV